MEFADQLMGHPHRKYKIIHIAGTNGKGSVSNMLTSVLAASGLKVGLYTSPHILDFRERMRVVVSSEQLKNAECRLVSKEYVWEFINQWQDTFDHLDMSFFEITTMMALNWFAHEEVDVVVLETGLGGRLDSTNIVSPVLSVITNIGLDHCDMLGETLPEIAFEKAGIIKPKVPVVVGESHPEIDAVFERKVLYTNLSEPEFMGSRTQIMSLLTFADKVIPSLWENHKEMLSGMDLQGEYQKKNLRTVLAALDVLASLDLLGCIDAGIKVDALLHTAARTDFHGRWEKLSDSPYTICDIGHNEHGLKYNFAQLKKMIESGDFSKLILVYGSVADKDVDAALRHLPEEAVCVFTQANSKRALAAEKIKEKYLAYCSETGRAAGDVYVTSAVTEALALSGKLAAGEIAPFVYIGGSTYVVSEAVAYLR
jgi:dihydrofolate synthase/folylpolyglutamate synthase